jgi:hypothetical protein
MSSRRVGQHLDDGLGIRVLEAQAHAHHPVAMIELVARRELGRLGRPLQAGQRLRRR